MITSKIKLNRQKFDNFNLDKLLAYSAIINALNYKWYKSSKKRLLLPNFYFTRSFMFFLKIFFFKNTFRKNIQFNNLKNFINPFAFFEKKMYQKQIFLFDFLKTNNIYFNFFKNNDLNFFSKNKFFFKNYNYLNLNSGLFVSKIVDCSIEDSHKMFFFKKKFIINNSNVYFDFVVFYSLSNQYIIEFYKTISLLYTNVLIKF